MFTGIIECLAELKEIRSEQSNLHFLFQSDISHELKVDQSVSHDGVCLTVTGIETDRHWVTAVSETLKRTNLGKLKVGDRVNVERCMKADGRFDGHIVQGHVDCTATCVARTDEDGSTGFRFAYEGSGISVEKGSVTVNGVSLTVVDSLKQEFSVVIIPYTLQHTNFSHIKEGDIVNIEFDIVGKYVARLMGNQV